MSSDQHLDDRRNLLKAGLGGAALLSLASELNLARAFVPRETLRLGLVGCGRQGRAILAELAKFENVELVALADPVDSRLESGLRRAKGAVGHQGHDALLAAHTDLDALIVATPTHLHRAPVLAALAAGLHVYCEAPLCHTLDDAVALSEAARASSKRFQVGMLGRVDPIYGLAHKFFRTGSIGDLVGLRAQSNQKTSWTTPVRDAADEAALNWRTDAKVSLGLAGEQGVHQFDVFHWFLEAYPRAVRGNGALRLWNDGREVPDTVSCTFEFEDGALLDWSATLANSYDGEHELLLGTLGSFKLAWTHGWLFKEADAPTQGWEVYANRQSMGNEQGITLIADATKLAAQDKLKDGVGLPEPPLWYGLEAFLKSAAENTPVACGASDGARAVAVALAAREAIQSGSRVEIDPEQLAAL